MKLFLIGLAVYIVLALFVFSVLVLREYMNAKPIPWKSHAAYSAMWLFHLIKILARK